MKTLLNYESGPYRSKNLNSFQKFLIWASGGDAQIIDACSYSDLVKYLCLGGIVLTTGILAGLAGGYAMYTVFGPPISLDGNTPPVEKGILLASIGFGIFWGWVILNLDRYILSATGKGDGTEKITWREFTTGLPRIILATIIALTIANPLEIRVLQPEINAELKLRQAEFLDELRVEVDGRYEENIARIEDERERVITLKGEAEKKVEELRLRYLDETQRVDRRGVGPIARGIKAEQTVVETQVKKYEDNINDLDEELETLLADREADREAMVNNAENLDGLAERISIAHEKYPNISLFITLLILGLELTPIFFKMMLVRSPYDYLQELVHRIIKARQGIEFRPEFYKEGGEDGSHIDVAKYHIWERYMEERAKVIGKQGELTGKIIDKWAEGVSDDIDEDVAPFVDEESDK